MKATAILIILNIVIFAAQAASGLLYCQPDYLQGCGPGMNYDPVTQNLGLIPQDLFSGHIWQFITYMFVHGDIYHILINMFIFIIFGPVVEATLGARRYLILYFLSGIGSALLHVVLTMLFSGSDLSVVLLGASGAIFGIVTAYGFLYPRSIIYLYVIPLPARYAVIFIAGFELFVGITGIMPGIANFGHLGGIITGAFVMWRWRRKGSMVKPFSYMRNRSVFDSW